MTSSDSPLRIFATVGSTRFDQLVSALLSPDFLSAINSSSTQSSSSTSLKSTAELTIQYGSTPLEDILTSKDSPFLSSRDEDSTLTPDLGLYFQKGKGLINRSKNPQAFDGGLTGSLNLEIGGGEDSKMRKRRMKKVGKQTTQDDEARHKSGEEMNEELQEEDQWIDEDEAEKEGEKENPTSIFQSGILEAMSPQGVKLKLFPFTSNLKEYLETSDIVISHAGSGTILEVLRLPKFQQIEISKPSPFPRLIVVPNTSLMDNHQVELAEALSTKNYLLQSLPWLVKVSCSSLDHSSQSHSDTDTDTEFSSSSSLLDRCPQSDLSKLIQSLLTSKTHLLRNRFPVFEPMKFRQIVDEDMGF